MGKFQYIILEKCVTNQLSSLINGIKIERMSEVEIFFKRQNIYNLRKFQEPSTSTKNTVKFGMELFLIEAHNYGT